MSAKYFIYRNLRTGGFSVRYRGRVIDRVQTAEASGCRFHVSAAGRLQATREGVRNVHAFVVAEHYSRTQCVPPDTTVVRYNPFKLDTFVVNDTPIHSASHVYFHGGHCSVLHEKRT